jgi:ketosteroid isomerase-like protein
MRAAGADDSFQYTLRTLVAKAPQVIIPGRSRPNAASASRPRSVALSPYEGEKCQLWVGRHELALEENAMPTETASTSDLTTLLELNRDYIRSVQTSDVHRFREILADDFLCSLPDGSLIDRERFLEHTARPVQISNLEVHDVNVRLMGDFAIIHARTTYTGPDGRSGSGRYTDVWARRHGRWVAVSAHVTRR